jgi:drug/metabolite transporter (DMT)-like permease
MMKFEQSPTLAKPPAPWQVVLILITGIFAISTAAILIRLAIEAAGTSGAGFSLVLSASRLIIASVLVMPVTVRTPWKQLEPGALRYAAFAGIALALHVVLWITSLSYTSIAASTTLVTTNPVWVAIISWLWYRERLSRWQILGIAIALTGGILIGLADAGAGGAGSNPLLGDALALMGSITVSFYLLLGREAQQRGLSTGRYSALAYTTAAILLLPVPVMFGVSYTGYPPLVYFYILLIAMIPQLMGHTILNWSLKWIAPTFVTLAILFEPVGSSLLGYVIFQEIPGMPVIMGALLLLLGVAIAVLGKNPNQETRI